MIGRFDLSFRDSERERERKLPKSRLSIVPLFHCSPNGDVSLADTRISQTAFLAKRFLIHDNADLATRAARFRDSPRFEKEKKKRNNLATFSIEHRRNDRR